MWLEMLADESRAPIGARDIAILVAHPGDETIGCGAQLRRLHDVTVIVLTDGARRDLHFNNRAKLEAAEAHAATRRQELQQVLQHAGIGIERLLLCGTSDLQAALQLPALVRQIADYLHGNKIRCLLTLCYEGGHPDRDAAAFVAHLAAAQLANQEYTVHLLEMPLSHRGFRGTVTQRFIADPLTPIDAQRDITLSSDEWRFKQELMNLYETQRAALRSFNDPFERFRAAPRYNFAALPNAGNVVEDTYTPGIRRSWLLLLREALRELDMPGSWY
jgi:LmbE family N-acetylglucosaminyl deacetylase